jgi:hypothetical protein
MNQKEKIQKAEVILGNTSYSVNQFIKDKEVVKIEPIIIDNYSGKNKVGQYISYFIVYWLEAVE